MARAQCLCGAVSFEAEIPKPQIQACHCRQCQRWTGGGALYVLRVKDVAVTGAEHIRAYHASEHGERAFCGTCGTTLYWKLTGGRISFLPVALFDPVPEGLSVTDEILVDNRAPWLPHIEGASQTTEAEAAAQLEAYLARKAAPS